MIQKTLITTGIAVIASLCLFPAASAAQEKQACDVGDRVCVLHSLEQAAQDIDNKDWRDQSYRELAKTLAYDGKPEQAVALIPRIMNPDTQAMTIRGIGMATADRDLKPEEYQAVFDLLHQTALTIKDPPSFAIALTYIAMSQAFAGDDEGAWKTAAGMENEALRNKAYQETAEIQAEEGHFDSAMKSVSLINSVAFRNKAHSNISKILADRGMLQEALNAAYAISNAYQQAVAIQYVLDVQNPREIPHE